MRPSAGFVLACSAIKTLPTSDVGYSFTLPKHTRSGESEAVVCYSSVFCYVPIITSLFIQVCCNYNILNKKFIFFVFRKYNRKGNKVGKMLFRVFGIYIKILFNFIYAVKHGVSVGEKPIAGLH